MTFTNDELNTIKLALLEAMTAYKNAMAKESDHQVRAQFVALWGKTTVLFGRIQEEG